MALTNASTLPSTLPCLVLIGKKAAQLYPRSVQRLRLPSALQSRVLHDSRFMQACSGQELRHAAVQAR